MRPSLLAAVAAALLATACSRPEAEAPQPEPLPKAAAAQALAPAAVEDELPGGAIAVDMALVPGLGPVERSPEALRRKLSTAPPQGVVLIGLPEGTWHFGLAPLTKTVGVHFALSEDRSELWFDGNRDGTLTPDEHRQGGRRFGRVVWHDGLQTLAERDLEGEVFQDMVFMAVGAQPKALTAFSRLDAHRAGLLTAGGRQVRIAVVDRTYRGWFGHAGRDRLLVDVDGDGRFETSDESHERYRLGEPIPIGELDYIATDMGLFGERLVFDPSPKKARRMAPLAVGHPAPELAGVALDGSEVRLSAHRGSWVLVDFWATWCGPCLRELPHLKKLKASHPELVVLGISGDRQLAALESFLERSPLPWEQIYDEKAPIRRNWRVTSLPTSYLVAPDGTIAAKSLRGSGLEKRFASEVERWTRAQEIAAGKAAGGL